MMRALAVMGGTFDPIHYGHLLAADQVRYNLKCDKVLFVPAFKSLYKIDVEMTSAEHRFEMTRLAVLTNEFFEVCDLEIKRGGISYTVDTLEDMRKLYPHCKLYFIVGVDAALGITGWKNWERILEICSIVAVDRPGYSIEDLWQDYKMIKYKKKIIFMKALHMPISSSYIREKVKKGEPIKYMLPESVEEYIKKHKLYL